MRTADKGERQASAGRPQPGRSEDLPGGIPAWTGELFRAIDAKDTDAFLRFLADDARFHFGNFPAASGREAIGAAVGGFFASIHACAHTITDVWTEPGYVICRGTVSYTRHDGRGVTVPFCNVLALAGERIVDYCVYIDPSPLFAP